MFEKINISHKISIFFPKKLTVLHKNWCWEKHSLLYPKGLHDMILSLYLKIHSFWPKTNTFCIKWYFLPKRNNAIKIWHFSKTENTFLRKLNISTRNEHFWKEWPFARKNENILQYWCFCKIFAFTSETHIMQQVTQNLLSFYSKLTTRLLQKPNVIFPKTDN